MNKKISFVIFACLLQSGFARAKSEIKIDGVDVTPFVSEVNASVLEVGTPFYTYSWFSAQPTSDRLQLASASDPWGYSSVQSKSQLFWKHFGEPAGANFFGRGLYLALDPVTTQSIGGASWGMFRVRLQKGMRILDLTKSRSQELSDESLGILSHFQCSSLKTLVGLMESGNGASSACRDFVQTVMRDAIRIDGFIYPYSSSFFSECQNSSPMRKAALVLTDPNRLVADDVRVFTPGTRDEIEERVRIQSLFYKADVDGTRSDQSHVFYLYQTKFLRETYPGMRSRGMTVQNGRSTMTLCPTDSQDQKLCKDVETPRVPQFSYPRSINLQNVPLSYYRGDQGENVTGQDFLWRDLEGHSTDQNLSSWVQGHFLGCSSQDFLIPLKTGL